MRRATLWAVHLDPHYHKSKWHGVVIHVVADTKEKAQGGAKAVLLEMDDADKDAIERVHLCAEVQEACAIVEG